MLGEKIKRNCIACRVINSVAAAIKIQIWLSYFGKILKSKTAIDSTTSKNYYYYNNYYSYYCITELHYIALVL